MITEWLKEKSIASLQRRLTDLNKKGLDQEKEMGP